MKGVRYLCVLLSFLFAVAFSSCVALRDGEGTVETEATASTAFVSETESESERESESRSSAQTTASTEPETTAREPAADGFPNEAESDGTKRY